MKYILMIIVFAVVACEKGVLVKDISSSTLVVNGPADGLKTSSNTVTFWWEPLKGADNYEFQIVRPDFAAPVDLVTDTIISANKLQVSLLPGDYQWRIRAVNSGYKTSYKTFSLKIDSTTILTNQLVIPIKPMTGYTTNQKTIQFSWQPLQAAESYSLEISMNNSIVSYTGTENTSFAFEFPISSAGTYSCAWRVKALNSTSISKFSEAIAFTIDLVAPTAAVPTLPQDNALVRDTVRLSWVRPAPEEIKVDSLYIYADSVETSPIRKIAATGTALPIREISPGSPLPAGTSSLTSIRYWWRLKSVDHAGNSSGFSKILTFRLY